MALPPWLNPAQGWQAKDGARFYLFRYLILNFI